MNSGRNFIVEDFVTYKGFYINILTYYVKDGALRFVSNDVAFSAGKIGPVKLNFF